MNKVRLKYLVQYQKGKVPTTFSEDASLPPYLSMEYLREKNDNVIYVEDDGSNILIGENEVLVLWDGANAGEIMLSKKGYLSSTMAILKPNEQYFHKGFFYYFLKSKERYFKEKANGTTIPHLDQEAFFGEHFEILPYHLQLTINNYLDTQSQKINHFITKKQQFIALLKEQRQSVINEAVTKGLNYDSSDFYDENDLNAEKKNQKNHNNQKNQKNHSSDKRRMKDSGIKWLGNIPENYQRTSLKRLVKVKITDGPHETPNFVEEGIPFVSAEGAFEGKIDLNKKRGFISEELHKEYCKKVKPQFGDIFIVKSGSTTGKTVIVDIEDEFNIWSPLALVRTNDLINNNFMLYSLQSEYFQKQVQQNWSFGTQPNIGMGVLERLVVIFPKSLSEQIQIVNHIKAETATIDNAIAKAEREIELIKEYKEAMIAEAVMGKVKMSEL